MSKKTSVVTSSSNLDSGKTTTTTTELPEWILKQQDDQRGLDASKKIVESNPHLENVKDQLPDLLNSLLEGDNESSIIKEGPVINIINLSGPNASVYLKSKDCSSNIANITPDDAFGELKEIISTNIQEETKRLELLLKIKELEQTRGTSDYLQKYTEFIAAAANHITFFQPILPVLAQWLNQ